MTGSLLVSVPAVSEGFVFDGKTGIDARPPLLSPDAVHIWFVDLDCQAAVSHLHNAMLDDGERQIALRFRHKRLTERYVAAHGSLRCILGAYLGVPPDGVTIERASSGKPFIGPSHGSRLTFSLSHADAIALIGVTAGLDVGVDVERVREIPEWPDLAARHFAPNEVAHLSALASERRKCGFFRIWTYKEAFLKATGEGLSRPLDSFDIAADRGRAPRIISIAGGRPEDWTLCGLKSRPGYVAAAAVRAASPRWLALPH